MQEPEKNIKQIRSLTIKGIVWGYLPLFIIGLIIPWLETLPEAIEILISFTTLISFVYGYIVCGNAADKYAEYKGYKNFFYIYSILNIFGLSFLFLLNNKNKTNHDSSNKTPLENFSISAIVISWFAIPLLFIPLFMLIALWIAGVQGFEEYHQNNENFSEITDIPVLIVISWYFIKEFKKANLNYKHILGSWRRIDFKLPVGLAVIKFLFAWGANNITLYGLSFIIPEYVEHQINKQYATSVFGWICFAIGALIFAPILEELIFRAILFQKLVITKNIHKALIISGMAFAIMHFRYDVIPLFIAGLLYTILYLKTNKLIIPIISHFFYNSIVLSVNLYEQLVSNTESSAQTTIAEFQLQVSDRWELYILLLAISTPYLCYFIYKNYPRHYNVDKLPYFVNQKTAI